MSVVQLSLRSDAFEATLFVASTCNARAAAAASTSAAVGACSCAASSPSTAALTVSRHVLDEGPRAHRAAALSH
eukprot:6829989-Pyramimonas_sp.AAC.1